MSAQKKEDMKKREIKKCKNIEKKLSDRGYNCKDKPTTKPLTKPATKPPTQPPTKPPKDVLSCARKDINFPGADLFQRYYGSIEQCIEDCLRTKLCKSITYRESDKKCYFKSKYGGISGPEKIVRLTSVNMECDNSAVTNLDCLRKGFNFPGNDLRNLIVENEEECVKHCRDTELCVSFTFRESDHRCYLRSKRGGSSGPIIEAGHNSMNMECDNSAVTNLDCLRKGFNFPGNDLRNLIVENEKECVKHCRDTELCVSFTFRESDQRCYLKSKRGGSIGPIIEAGHNSMNMECDNSAVTNLDCLRKGFNFPGNDLRNLIVENEEECVKHCRDTELCVSFTFRESDHRCYLRSKRGGSSGPTITAGHNSMNMECDNSVVTNLDCLRKGFNFPGNDLRNLIVENEEECVKFCRDTELCVSFTFRESDQRCYLKSKRGGSIGPIIEAGHNSMNMECDNSAVTNLDCLRKGFNFPGNDLRNLIVENEEECVKHCRDTELCVSFTFRESDQRCYLKSKRGGSIGPIIEAGHNSMNMECDNSAVTNLDCLRKGFNFPGNDLRNLIVENEEECVKHCRDTELCVSLIFRESDHRCYLRSKRGGSSGPIIEAGHNSMNMECDNSQVDLSCSEEDTKFPGQDIRSIILDNLEACVNACRDTQDCLAVEFDDTNFRCYLKKSEFEWWQFQSKVGSTSLNINC